MEAKELRIGNLIQYNGKEIAISPVGLSEYYYLSDTHAESKTDKRNYEPIPLTAERLERFGFEIFPWGYVLNGILLSTNHKDEFWVELGNGKRISFEYVHTLQNFFALTGEELIPKE